MIDLAFPLIFVDQDEAGTHDKILDVQTRTDSLGKAGFAASQRTEKGNHQPRRKILGDLLPELFGLLWRGGYDLVLKQI